jgi:hypothetical protein
VWLIPTLAAGQPAGAPAPQVRIAIDEPLAGERILTAAPSFPVAARITMEFSSLLGDRAASTLERLDGRLRDHAAAGVPVWISITAPVPTVEGVGTMVDTIRAMADRAGPRVAWYEIGVAENAADIRLTAFALKQMAVELRSVSPATRVLASVPPRATRDWLEQLYREEVASYLDGVAIGAGEGDAFAEALVAVVQHEDPGALVASTGVPIASADAIASTALERLGQTIDLTSFRGEPQAARASLTAARHIADLLAGDIVALDPVSSRLAIEPAGVRAVLLYDVARFATTVIYAPASLPERAEAAPRSVTVDLTLRVKSKPEVRDPFTGSRRPVIAYARDDATQRTRVEVPFEARTLILDLNDGLEDVVTDRSDVTGRSELSVGEIIARHQQAEALQKRLVESFVVSARMEQHFRPTVTDPGFDVVSENRFFSDRGGVEWEELSFSVNGTKWGPDRPAFPLLQPEKVLSPPLDLALDAAYRYRLEGTARVDGADCWVVRFDPLTRDRSLYRGTVWIDRDSFRRVKIQAVQTGLSAPVVSNEETVRFAKAGEVNGRDVFLPLETTAKQIVLIAGRNILVEKASRFTSYELNPDDFTARRLEARRGERIMYRETDKGIRYYVKEGDARVVSERATTRAKAMAIGTTIDPAYDFPLPIFGINYLDFEFGGPDSQLALLFGGVLALGNVQRPKLVGPLDGSLDFFAIAVPGSDRLYDEQGERELERLLTWPLSAGANLGYQFTSFQKLSAQYQFRFDGFLRERTTAESYIVPTTTTTHGIGLAWEYRRAGYSVVANTMWYGRLKWEPWGPAAAPVTSPRTYTKYSVNASKEFFLNVFSKMRVNAAYFGGDGLDRFSQYQFGLFDDTRIHGVPSSGVRFGELVMLRGSYSFNVFEQYRFDAFLDRAWGRDRDASQPLMPVSGTELPVDSQWPGLTGIGLAFNLRAPWSTILRAEVGKSFLPDRYRGNGSVVMQVMLLKPLN